MITLQAPLELKQCETGNWELLFLVGDIGDYTTPFRSILKKIASILERDGQVVIELPEYEGYEDFVEGSLQFEGTQLSIYFEHSLSYLTLWGDSKQLLSEIMDRVQVEFKS